jgi:eukaryotic-like serine/threonine-protein kinase
VHEEGRAPLSTDDKDRDAANAANAANANTVIADGPSTPSLVPSITPSSPGSAVERLGGRYELLGLLGVGGMGSVYRARDLELDELVALKMLSRELVDTPGVLARFRQEVKLARRVTHHNVARTFDIGVHEGQQFLTMELVEGESLARVLERNRVLPVRRIIDIARPICAGLAAAHDAHVVHRDLKPDNVLIAKDGRVVITDFGIARVFASVPVKTQGLPIGTPAYMAPEQVEGAADIDARADIYALGAMLFEMVTGTRAWEGESVIAVAAARLLKPPPDPRDRRKDVPDAVASMILKCMQRKPADRYAHVREVMQALDVITAPLTPTMAVPSSAQLLSVAGSSPVSRSAIALTPAPDDRTVHGDKTVAVLPFRNGGPQDDAYLAEGLTDDLIDALSMTRGLKVRSRGAVMHLEGKGGDPRDLGRDLGVQVVVDGSLRRIGAKVRVGVRLVSVADGFLLWAKRFDRPVGEVLVVGDEAASAIADVLTVVRNTSRPDVAQDPEVVDLYLRARHEYHKFWADANARALELFAQAHALAPNDPRVLGGYAMSLGRRFSIERQALNASGSAARDMANRALAIDPKSAEAHVALATVAWGYGEVPAAAREILAAFRANPRFGDAHDYYGRLLIEVGRLDEGIARLQAAATIEPKLWHVFLDIARAYALKGDWENSDLTLALPPPGDPFLLNNYWLIRVRLVAWRRDAAMALKLRDEILAGPSFEAQMSAAGVCTMLVEREVPPEMREFFRQRIGEVDPLALKRRSFAGQLNAEMAGIFGDAELGLISIEQADEARLIDIGWMERCPLLDQIRSHPRFAAVYARVRERAAEVNAILPR